ncbi:MAG: YbjN domain-containing protein [Bacteroidota bacterium]|nr:YbjN domain-containing protein [Bacteroidota bacterium]
MADTNNSTSTIDLQQVYKEVEEGINLAGVDATLCRTENDLGQWNLKTGETEIWIDIYSSDEEHDYFQVMSPLVYIPNENRENFYRELLDLNYQMIGIHFVTYKEGVYLKFMKDAAHTQSSEVFAILSRFGKFGPAFLHGFVEKFNTKPLQHHDK